MPEDLLKEIRDQYRYLSDRWKPHQEQRRIDMRYICGDPWEPEDRKARADAGRPCISHDELNQYVNQCVNSVRQNRRGIVVEPARFGASQKTAELRQDIIRTIEYSSRAHSIYSQAFQAMVEGSYAFFRVGRRYVSPDSFDQEIVFRPIPNPDSVLFDLDCKEPDWSDARRCFVLEPVPREEFPIRWPDAEVKSFTTEHVRLAQDWIRERDVVVAEYWRVETEHSMLYLLPNGEKVTTLPDGVKPARSRTVERRKVVQYLTNGIEILERNEQPGEIIPIIPMMGLVRYIDRGSGPEMVISGLVRLARDPQMSLAYLCSQEMEEAGLTPKVPYVGYKGQFESDSEAWDTAHKIPHSHLQVDPIVDAATGAVLPLPRRENFTPNFGQYELAKDSARRAIQAAMGIMPLPTAAQRDTQKSGVALQRIQAQQEVGSFHLVDAYEQAIQLAGRVADSWIPVTYDAEREMAVRKADDSRRVIRVNTSEPYTDQEHPEQPQQYSVGEGEHDITITTAPSHQSQMDAVSDFLDLLVGSLGRLPVTPPQAAKLLSMSIRMKQLGPKGDEMADIISPRDNEQQQIPAQVQEYLQKMQQQLQAVNAYAQQKEAELAELQKKLDGKVIENEYRLKIEQLKIEADLAKAEIATKAQVLEERIQFVEDVWRQLQRQAQPAAEVQPQPAVAEAQVQQ